MDVMVHALDSCAWTCSCFLLQRDPPRWFFRGMLSCLIELLSVHICWCNSRICSTLMPASKARWYHVPWCSMMLHDAQCFDSQVKWSKPPCAFCSVCNRTATRVGSRPLGALEANVEGQHFQNGLIFKSTNHQFSFLLELSGVQRLILPHFTRIISPERGRWKQWKHMETPWKNALILQPSSPAAQQIASELLGEEREPNAHERQHAELNALPWFSWRASPHRFESATCRASPAAARSHESYCSYKLYLWQCIISIIYICTYNQII